MPDSRAALVRRRGTVSITPELANKIGYDLAMSLTKGTHAFIVCTHVDKHHIHSHIVFNSIALNCTRKFRNFWRSSFAIRKISDMLCMENGLGDHGAKAQPGQLRHMAGRG